MKRKQEIVAEIYKLIDEQLALLKNTFVGSSAEEYVQRKKRIEELLKELSTGPAKRHAQDEAIHAGAISKSQRVKIPG